MPEKRAPERFFRPKRRFGQNFLIDRSVLSEIVERAAVAPDDVLLEVGPGEGVLTTALLLKGCARLHAVELDFRLKDALERLQAQNPRLNVLWNDAVRADYGALSPFPNKVVANIPYSITTPLIWRLLAFASRGLTYHLYMVQKEAMERLTAPRDTKERYPLGVALEVMGTVALVRRVPPSCFRPAPRVDSALVEIELKRNLFLTEDSLWSDLLHAGFHQRRKTLLNNLKGFRGRGLEEWQGLMDRVKLDPRIRAEDLSGEEWLLLYDALYDALLSAGDRKTAAPVDPANGGVFPV
ncbi:MAG: 16S rRNA (adenine(1518)-N(6)/adenine(1519)-N(6))-dimethyltransferase RsmA [Synergistaceae bacterium]|jgi:16S rRNA (adenine1518-N6/adenine1519-N6)-dimethyltransferase|nr:16S rRNA (adenine(1518)-N(6)/adenine(1519)-N(6))-dimethyltransferase RsmA [Synergistaceae bacterium]